jgi:hypothetical protein
MATLRLKNVPEDLLHASLTSSRRSGDETVKALRRLHKRLAGLSPLTDAFLNRAKNEGRP